VVPRRLNPTARKASYDPDAFTVSGTLIANATMFPAHRHSQPSPSHHNGSSRSIAPNAPQTANQAEPETRRARIETAKFTSSRSSGDTTVNLVIPKSTSLALTSYPIAGIVTRSMKVVMTVEGSAGSHHIAARSLSRTDGVQSPKITITQDRDRQVLRWRCRTGRPVCP
jgi:hypothetical protein